MVLSSEIIEIVARSSDICIFWTRGRFPVQEGNYWTWRGGGMCPVFPTPGSAPGVCVHMCMYVCVCVCVCTLCMYVCVYDAFVCVKSG